MPHEFCHTDNSEFWDDDPWDAFLDDDDERDPWPEPGDFWTEDDDDDEFSFHAHPSQELPPCCH